MDEADRIAHIEYITRKKIEMGLARQQAVIAKKKNISANHKNAVSMRNEFGEQLQAKAEEQSEIKKRNKSTIE